MKIIQSIWTHPLKHSGHVPAMTAGWPHKLLHYFSCALSCLQLRRYYPEVILYTDQTGKDIFIDKIGLPYSTTQVVLNDLDKYNPSLWALGKLYTYQLQQEPFLHVDNDVFIWRPFSEKLMNSGLIAQNMEHEAGGYQQAVRQLCGTFPYVPGYLKMQAATPYITYCNAGILGGNDIPFIQSYTQQSFSFLHYNESIIYELTRQKAISDINAIYEQLIFQQYAASCNKHIDYLFPGATAIPPEIGFFTSANISNGYIHSYGYYKSMRFVYTLLENKLRTMYPDYYNRILQLATTDQI